MHELQMPMKVAGSALRFLIVYQRALMAVGLVLADSPTEEWMSYDWVLMSRDLLELSSPIIEFAHAVGFHTVEGN